MGEEEEGNGHERHERHEMEELFPFVFFVSFRGHHSCFIVGMTNSAPREPLGQRLVTVFMRV